MKNIIKIKRLKHKGFTLIELLVVIVIIGILASFSIARYVDITDNANTISLEAHHRNYIYAIKLYKLNNNMQKPISKSDLSPYMTEVDLDGNPKNSVYKIENNKFISELRLLNGTIYKIEFNMND